MLALGVGTVRRRNGRGARPGLQVVGRHALKTLVRPKDGKEPPYRPAIAQARGRGVVKQYDPESGHGSISLNRLATEQEVLFSKRDAPKEFLAGHNDEVPVGVPVEFDMQKKVNGKVYASNLIFPGATSLMELGLRPDVVRGAAAALGIDPRENPDAAELILPAPVQAEAIPKILSGENLVIAAETGSGKTLAYMLPLVQQVQELESRRSMDYGLDCRASSPLGLVLCPTRELALQACKILKLICHHARLRVRLVYGGTGTWRKQRREISDIVDILVATPDRLMKFYNENDIKFTDVAHVAIDEADFLLTQGFADVFELLREVSAKSRHSANLRYTLVTASITKPLWKIFQEDPRWKNMRVLESRSLHRPQANCSHSFLLTKGRDKLEMLISLLRPELSGNVPSKQTLVFCNTVSGCRAVAWKLQDAFQNNRNNRYIGALHKEMPSNERQEVLRAFSRGELRVVVCTDIAQRGLDLPNCGHVICFDFPLNSIDYLHRAGRTARYGEEGKVTSLVKKGDKYLAKAIERAAQLGKPINNLSADKRDYLRGGALYHLLERHPRASAAERGLPPPRKYDGSLR